MFTISDDDRKMDQSRVVVAISRVPHSTDCAHNTGKWYCVDSLPSLPTMREAVKGWYFLACTCNRDLRMAALIPRAMREYGRQAALCCSNGHEGDHDFHCEAAALFVL